MVFSGLPFACFASVSAFGRLRRPPACAMRDLIPSPPFHSKQCHPPRPPSGASPNPPPTWGAPNRPPKKTLFFLPPQKANPGCYQSFLYLFFRSFIINSPCVIMGRFLGGPDLLTRLPRKIPCKPSRLSSHFSCNHLLKMSFFKKS